jgi:hypothetical protein
MFLAATASGATRQKQTPTCGVAASVAIFGRGERAVSVFVALVPFLGVVLFVLAELLIGHD